MIISNPGMSLNAAKLSRPSPRRPGTSVEPAERFEVSSNDGVFASLGAKVARFAATSTGSAGLMALASAQGGALGSLAAAGSLGLAAVTLGPCMGPLGDFYTDRINNNDRTVRRLLVGGLAGASAGLILGTGVDLMIPGPVGALSKLLIPVACAAVGMADMRFNTDKGEG